MTFANRSRIEQTVEALAQFNATPGAGITRLSYTAEYRAAQAYLKQELEAAGLSVRLDPMGNLIGRKEGTDRSLAAIAVGSHLDSVRNGGKYDGAMGIICGLELARMMQEDNLSLRHSFEVIAIVEEEGNSFGSGILGGKALSGLLETDYLKQLTNNDGVTAYDVMKTYGLTPDDLPQVKRDKTSWAYFIEPHIEQGPVLEKEKVDVGIVEAIVGIKCFNVYVYGRSDHAGTTPLNMRADTMLATARAIVAGTDKAKELDDGTVVTFGRVETQPGAFNIVAKETLFDIDCRSKTLESVDKVIAAVKASLEQSQAENPGLSFRIVEKLTAQPVLMKPEVQELLEQQAAQAGISTRKMLSGAGHDAMVMGSLCDVAMIFVPSKDGRSHVPEEWTDYEDLRKGAELLCRCVRQLASK